ncbi:MAG: 30S ribosomal protein S14 [Planctomycetota bacterium]|nr:30S ribosomal protein S14 [Planctomycetota bacterium]
MTKKSILIRESRRRALAAQHAEKRDLLVKVIKDPAATLEEKAAAYRAIDKLPRDASKVRQHNRCQLTGRPRAYLRRFGLSRLMVRKLAHQAELPGVRKSSW